MSLKEETISLDKAGDLLADILQAKDVPFEIGTFDDFVQNIFSLSYPNYNFNTWHIRLLSYKVDELLTMDKDDKFLLVVLPRYHLKSTLLGYASSIYRMLTGFGDGIYISYKDELCLYHLSNIKTSINNNSMLSKVFVDLHPQSESGIGYKIGNRKLRMFSAGVFSVKRGIHCDSVVICDDLEGDLQNPMTFTELEKTKRIFNAEIMNIPNKGCPLLIFGTVIDYSDLLFNLKDNLKFESIWMSAVNPDPNHDVLWGDMYPKSWLEERKKATGWKAFSTEFLLTPALATEAFISREELDKVIDSSLKNYQVPGW